MKKIHHKGIISYILWNSPKKYKMMFPIDKMEMVLPAGFEPGITGLRGQPPDQLEDGSICSKVLVDVGAAPTSGYLLYLFAIELAA